MKDIAGKVAFVTGAANGIGLGICRALARAGAHVALADIQPDALERAREEIAGIGVRAIAIPLDVSDAAAVERAADTVQQAFGKVHIVCNNAGVSLGNNRVLQVPPDQVAWMFGVNLFGVLHGVRSFVPCIRAHGEGGHIVNTASIGGLQVNRELGTGVYAMTKYGVVALSEALEHELDGSGIGVSVLCPALVDTTLYRSGERRPDRFGGAYDRADLADAQSRMAAGMAPDAVGERVLRAIRDSDFFVFTHQAPRAWIEARHARLMAGFDAI